MVPRRWGVNELTTHYTRRTKDSDLDVRVICHRYIPLRFVLPAGCRKIHALLKSGVKVVVEVDGSEVE